MNRRIFILEDDFALCEEMEQYLSELDFAVETAYSLSEAFPKWQAFEPDIALLDLKLPDGEGTELLKEIKTHSPEIMVFMLSGTATIQDAVEAMRQGAEDFFTKPMDPDHLMLVLNRHFERRQQLANARVMELEIANSRKMIVGNSPAMQKLLEDCQKAAQAKTTILINGATGTGKHMAAHFIHQNSPRKDFPFVYVNCATFSDNLLESDLFGYEKGAFTGANEQKKGMVEIADRGSIFLDEIGEIPINLQAKLLNYVENGQFQRLGGTATRFTDTRIICATNRDLPGEVREGRFREDLFFRISVIQLRMPSLKERPDDIEMLLSHFLEKFRQDMNRAPMRIAESTLLKLKGYHWPGNIRELQNSVERAVVLASSDTLGDPNFPFLQTPTVGIGNEDGLFRGRPLADAVNDFKREFLEAVLKTTDGNQRKAAEILDVQRPYLNQLMRKLNIRS